MEQEEEKIIYNTIIPPAIAMHHQPVYILTEDGWVDVASFKVKGRNGLKAATLSLNGDSSEDNLGITYKNIVSRDIFDYEDYFEEDETIVPCLRFKGKNFDEIGTVTQVYPIFSKLCKFKGYYTFNDLKELPIRIRQHAYLLRSCKWEGSFPESMKDKENIRLFGYSEEDILMPISEWVRFVGYFLNDGSTDGKETSIVTKNDSIADFMEAFAMTNHFHFTMREGKKNQVTYVIRNTVLSRYLKNNCYEGGSTKGEKKIPRELKYLPTEFLQDLYDAYSSTMGEKVKKKQAELFALNRQLALDINEIQFKTGAPGNYREEDYYDENRLLDNETRTLFFSTKGTAKTIYLDDPQVEIIADDTYKGKMVAFEIEGGGPWYCMYGGKTHWICGKNQTETITAQQLQQQEGEEEIGNEGN